MLCAFSLEMSTWSAVAFVDRWSMLCVVTSLTRAFVVLSKVFFFFFYSALGNTGTSKTQLILIALEHESNEAYICKERLVYYGVQKMLISQWR